MHLVLKAGTILDGLQPVNFRQRKQQQGWLTGIRLCIIMCVHSHFLSLQVHASVSIVPLNPPFGQRVPRRQAALMFSNISPVNRSPVSVFILLLDVFGSCRVPPPSLLSHSNKCRGVSSCYITYQIVEQRCGVKP